MSLWPVWAYSYTVYSFSQLYLGGPLSAVASGRLWSVVFVSGLLLFRVCGVLHMAGCVWGGGRPVPNISTVL